MRKSSIYEWKNNSYISETMIVRAPPGFGASGAEMVQNPKEMHAFWSIPFRQRFAPRHRPQLLPQARSGQGRKCYESLRFLGVPDSTPLQTSPLSSLEKKQSLILKGGWRRI